MAKLILLVTTCSLYFFSGYASQTESLKSPIEEVIRLRQRVIDAKTESARIVQNDSFKVALHDFLKTDSSFTVSLEGVSFIGDLFAPDGRVRFILWNLPLDNGTYRYYGFLQTKLKKKGPVQLTELTDGADNFSRPDFKTLKEDEWYGALYYEIVPFKRNKTTAYALLGWRGVNTALQTKVIDVLTFTKSGSPRFGAPVFKMGIRANKRVIFKHAKEAYMALRYIPKEKSIVYNRLYPKREDLAEIYEFYVPEIGIFDGLQLKRGNWEEAKDLDIRKPKENRTWNNPERKNLPVNPK